MIRRTVTQAALAAALVLPLAVHAARADEAAPTPSPEIRRMAALAGSWEGTGSLSMDGKSATVHFRHDVHPIANGFGVQVDEQFDSDLTGHYEAVNICGYDPNTGRMHIYTVDNFADAHDHAGRWVDDHTLQLRHTGTVDGKKYVEDLTLTVASPDTYAIAIKSTLGGKPYEAGKATLHRIGTASR